MGSGRRLSSAAGTLLILSAVAHTIGHVPLLSGAERGGSIVAMSVDRSPLGLRMEPSMLDIHLALVLTMSVTFVALGVATLLVAFGDASARLHRRIVWLDAVCVGILVAVYAYYRVPPPLISTVLIEAALVAALFLGRTSNR